MEVPDENMEFGKSKGNLHINGPITLTDRISSYSTSNVHEENAIELARAVSARNILMDFRQSLAITPMRGRENGNEANDFACRTSFINTENIHYDFFGENI